MLLQTWFRDRCCAADAVASPEATMLTRSQRSPPGKSCLSAAVRTLAPAASQVRTASHRPTQFTPPRQTRQNCLCLCPHQRCELDSRRRQLKTVADRKFEVGTRSQQSSNSHRHTRHDTDRIVLSCLAGGVNWA